MRATESNAYAIGDIAPAPMLAHAASAVGSLSVEHIADKDVPPHTSHRVPPAQLDPHNV